MAKYEVLREQSILGARYRQGDAFDDPNLKPGQAAALVRQGMLREVVDDAPENGPIKAIAEDAAKAQTAADRETVKAARKAPEKE